MRRLALTLLLLVAPTLAASAAAAAPAQRLRTPLAVRKLANGLTVVVSEDHSAPTFGICTAYRIGFRLEPKGRTGFAHLFEHMMFEGTPTAPKGTLSRVIEGGGGVLNGSTRYDYTNYIASAPVSALEPILWLEADRMKTLDFSEKNLENQQEVVKEEIRVNVKNRPYGLFFWTDLAGKAFDKWENAHDGYGSFEDLDAASLKDVESFFGSYYGPGNAVVAIVGDLDPADTFAKIETYFGGVPARPAPPRPDVSEPLNTSERTLTQTDPLARVPALAVGWKLPSADHGDRVPAALLGDLLVGGEASRLYQRLVKGKELLLSLQGGANWPLGSSLEFGDGPTLLTIFAVYKPTTDARAIVAAMNEEIQTIARDGVPADELARTKTKMLSNLYSELEHPLFRSITLSIAQLFTGDAGAINALPDRVESVTSADVQRVARTYLTAANRTVVDRQPAPRAGQQNPGGETR